MKRNISNLIITPQIFVYGSGLDSCGALSCVSYAGRGAVTIEDSYSFQNSVLVKGKLISLPALGVYKLTDSTGVLNPQIIDVTSIALYSVPLMPKVVYTNLTNSSEPQRYFSLDGKIFTGSGSVVGSSLIFYSCRASGSTSNIYVNSTSVVSGTGLVSYTAPSSWLTSYSYISTDLTYSSYHLNLVTH